MSEAARSAGVGRTSLFDWRRDDPEFDAQVLAAVEEGTDSLITVARNRAKEKSDLLMIFLLKQRDPSFRDNHQIQIDTGGSLNNLFDALRNSTPKSES